MDVKGKFYLTNEEVTKKFTSTFDLVNYAIQLAENMIRTGRETRVKSDIQNRAMLILEEIEEGKDKFDEIEISFSPSDSELDVDSAGLNHTVFEEKVEKNKFQIADSFEGDE